MAGALDTKNPLNNIDDTTLKSAMEASRSPLILTDYQLPDNPIVYSNQAFLDLTGYSMRDIIGRNCRFLQGPDTDKKTVSQLRRAVKKGEYVRVTIQNYTKRGQPFWNDLIMSPIKDAAGKTTHFMGMQVDISDRILAEQRLLERTRELEASNKELEQFTFAASHDLQEPLRMISSYLQLIDRRYSDTLDADARTFLGYATEGADRMQQLVYDLLALSRITTTTDGFEPVDLREVVDRALFNLKLAIEESNAEITIEDLPRLNADAVQMTQLFQNLISNAIKYRRPRSRPRIRIRAEKVGSEYVFSVSDNGIGIPREQYARVFVVFQRLHTHAEYSGTGVGLALCSKIIDRHGGKIWVESTVGKGSVFKFSLPVRQRRT